MSNFKEAHKILCQAEFSNKPEKFLHKNPNENDLTLGGIYSKYHQLATDWHFIKGMVSLCQNDIKRSSTMLYNDEKTQEDVHIFFKSKFWDKMRLDEVQSQKIATEIYLSGVHIGIKNAVKLAQETVMTETDGIIGSITIKCLNNFNEDNFATHFTKLEKENYNKIIERNPDLKYAESGFMARSEIIT